MPATVKIIWTAEEDAHLMALRKLGYTNQQIGCSVGRPRATVGFRIASLIEKLPPEQHEAMRNRGPSPNEPAPTLRTSALSMRVDGWTKEVDDKIRYLRADGYAYRRIGKLVGRSESAVYARLIKLGVTGSIRQETKKQPVIDKSTVIAEPFRIPAGPVPSRPDEFPHPNKPAWRTCLGDGCGRVFYSPNGGVRRCPRCKGVYSSSDGKGIRTRVIDTPELRVYL